MAVVLVTGSRTGIGRVTALAFAERGDVVYATVRDSSRGMDHDTGLSDRIFVRGLDVTKPHDMDDLIAEIEAEQGRLDAVINNAGITGPAAPIEEIDEEAARLVWETNFWGPLRVCRAVLPMMRRQRSGVIVNVSSFSARWPRFPWLAMYASSKAALSQASGSLDAEVRPFGVRVVAVEPSFYATEIFSDDKRRPLRPGSPYAAAMAEWDARNAANVVNGGDPVDVAHAVVDVVEEPLTDARVIVGDGAIVRWGAYLRAQLAAWEVGEAAPAAI